MIGTQALGYFKWWRPHLNMPNSVNGLHSLPSYLSIRCLCRSSQRSSWQTLAVHGSHEARALCALPSTGLRMTPKVEISWSLVWTALSGVFVAFAAMKSAKRSRCAVANGNVEVRKMTFTGMFTNIKCDSQSCNMQCDRYHYRKYIRSSLNG